MALNIVADSSCDYYDNDVKGEDIQFSTVPFSFLIDGDNYVDDEQLDVDNFLTAMESSPEIGVSSCPDPHVWLEKFKNARESIAVTISCNLSGSLNSALVAKKLALEESIERKIAIVDSKATGPAAAMVIERMKEWKQAGHSFDEIVAKAQEYANNNKTVFALCSFDNLVKNGRMNRLVGFIAGALHMWGIGIASDEGTIIMKGKAKGKGRMLKQIVDDMKERGFNGKEVVISHCKNAATAEKLKEMIQEKWSEAKVTILKTRGLDSFYAEREGLIVTYE